MKLIQKGNRKLSLMYMFNLPATREVCGRECKGCYAIGEQKRYPNVLPARQSRYEASLQPDFVSRIKSEISNIRNKPKYFRIHSSGEFYDQAYINKWISIANSFPDIVFYTYTKRMKDFDFTKLKALPNVVLIDSFHYGRINYGKPSTIPSNAFVCPHQKGSSVTCGESCVYCMSKQAEIKAPYFIQH